MHTLPLLLAVFGNFFAIALRLTVCRARSLSRRFRVAPVLLPGIAKFRTESGTHSLHDFGHDSRDCFIG